MSTEHNLAPLLAGFSFGRNSKAARALHRAALEANCRAGPGSVRRLDNDRGHVAFHGADHALVSHLAWRNNDRPGEPVNHC